MSESCMCDGCVASRKRQMKAELARDKAARVSDAIAELRKEVDQLTMTDRERALQVMCDAWKAEAEQSRALAQAQAERIADYEAVLADKRRLAREIDVAMHGEEGAAKQASLCDLVEPARMMRERVAALEAEVARLGMKNAEMGLDLEISRVTDKLYGKLMALLGVDGPDDNPAEIVADMHRQMAEAEAAAEAAESSLAETRAKVEGLEKALREAEETLRLVERPAFPDPIHHERVKALGREIGFGAMMTTASAGWREVVAERGHPTGGEFVAGPCLATVQMALAKVPAALAALSEAKPAAQAEGE